MTKDSKFLLKRPTKNLIIKLIFASIFFFFFVLLILFSVNSLAATFSFSPSKYEFKEACKQSLDVNIDATGELSSAADIEIYYNPKEIKILDSNQDQAGIQIKNGNAYESYFGNEVRPEIGRIRLAGASFINNLQSQKKFATIEFESFSGVKSTELSILFDGVGATIDSNIADAKTSEDLLTGVNKAQLTFKNDFCQEDVTPPSYTFLNPKAFARNVKSDSQVSLRITDNLSGVNVNSIEITLNGQSYKTTDKEVSLTGRPLNYEILITPRNPILEEQENTLQVKSEDLRGNKSNQGIAFNIPEVVCPVLTPEQVSNLVDTDKDAQSNLVDPDIDGDGQNNVFDPDIDGDGQNNKNDADIDADGLENPDDSSPSGSGDLDDVDGDGIPNSADSDIDGDDTPNKQDSNPDGSMEGQENIKYESCIINYFDEKYEDRIEYQQENKSFFESEKNLQPNSNFNFKNPTIKFIIKPASKVVKNSINKPVFKNFQGIRESLEASQKSLEFLSFSALILLFISILLKITALIHSLYSKDFLKEGLTNEQINSLNSLNFENNIFYLSKQSVKTDRKVLIVFTLKKISQIFPGFYLLSFILGLIIFIVWPSIFNFIVLIIFALLIIPIYKFKAIFKVKKK